MIQLPDYFKTKIAATFKEAGKQWINEFPSILESCIDYWSLSEIQVIPDLSVNFIARARMSTGRYVVLKAGVPSAEFNSEVEALQILDGTGYVKLLDANMQFTAMILEEIRPGTPLADIEDWEQATRIAAVVMKRSLRPAPKVHSLPSVLQWTKGLDKLRPHYGGGTGPFQEAHVKMAESLFSELIESSDTEVLIHGDYHHWNILRDGNGDVADDGDNVWRIIDPKGLVGPPGYEIGQFLGNFPNDLEKTHNIGEVNSRRIDIFSEVLEIPRRRLLKWGFAQRVLSTWWCVEDGSDCLGHGLATIAAMAPLVEAL
ncbi:MAG: phosphotransferase [Spirochaetales bacterium]|nr:phosphotransferase [Spirochaetales bacterium]